MARTVALVDQIDQHIANLTVRETLEFAYICQVRMTCSACCPADAPLIWDMQKEAHMDIAKKVHQPQVPYCRSIE